MKKSKRMTKRFLSLFLAVIMTAACFTFVTGTASAAGNVSLDFSGDAAAQYFINPHSMMVKHSSDEDAVVMAIAGDDPFVTLNVEGMTSVSADTYKYLVLTYRTPVTNSSKAKTTELFLSSGSVTGPTAGKSILFSPVKSYKYRSEVIDLTNVDFWNGKVHNIRIDAFTSGEYWDAFYLKSMTFCSDASAANSAASAMTAAANGYINDISESKLASASYDLASYTQSYWKGNIVYNESVFPLANPDGSVSPSSLMFDIKRVISVRNGALGREYKYGVDYTVTSDGKFQVIPGGSIPVMAYNDFYKTTAPASSSALTWQPLRTGGYTYFCEGSYFHNKQIFITYTHEDAWDGYVQESGVSKLPITYSKLQNKQHVVAVFFGDSITFGANASGLPSISAAPNMPLWTDMTIAALKSKYGYNDIAYANTAVGGKTSEWGVETAYENVGKYVPDIVFIGFGMNDGTMGLSAAQFKANIETIMNTARTHNPNCEFILVASMSPNPATLWLGNQPLYLDVLKQIEREQSGVAVADMWTTHNQLLGIKKYADMTGNNVNHPNDFLIRYYAQTMLAVLSPSDLPAAKASAITALSNYVSLDDYRAEERAQVQSLIDTGIANINAAASTDAVSAALSAAKSAVDAVKTAAQYDAENLDYECLIFDSQTTLSAIKKLASLRTEIDTEKGMTSFISTGDDPHVRFSYDVSGLSADTYKYVTLVYKVPSSVSNTTETQVFFTAGSQTGESEDASVKFNAEKGTYAYKTIDLSSASYWNGKIHSLRLDTFRSYESGDEMKLYSIKLSKTASEASEYASFAIDVLNGTYIGRNETINLSGSDQISRLTSDVFYKNIGDANGDGEVGSKDSRELKLHIVGTKPVSDILCADADGDGEVTVRDALLVKKSIAGLVSLGSIETPAAEIAYSSAKKGAVLTAKSDPSAVLASFEGKNISADDLKNVSLEYINDSGADMTVTVSLVRDGSEISGTAKTFTAHTSSSYSKTVLNFADIAAWSGDIDEVKIAFSGSSLCLGKITVSEFTVTQ